MNLKTPLLSEPLLKKIAEVPKRAAIIQKGNVIKEFFLSENERCAIVSFHEKQCGKKLSGLYQLSDVTLAKMHLSFGTTSLVTK